MGEMFLDPTDKVERAQKVFAPRLDTLEGKTVGLLGYQQSQRGIFS